MDERSNKILSSVACSDRFSSEVIVGFILTKRRRIWDWTLVVRAAADDVE
jgi:hypothetical protein